MKEHTERQKDRYEEKSGYGMTARAEFVFLEKRKFDFLEKKLLIFWPKYRYRFDVRMLIWMP